MKFILLTVWALSASASSSITSQQIEFASMEACKKASEIIKEEYKKNLYVRSVCISVPLPDASKSPDGVLSAQ